MFFICFKVDKYRIQFSIIGEPEYVGKYVFSYII